MSCIRPVIPSTDHLPWYGIRTRSNCEKTAASVLHAKGYQQFLPCYKVRRRWSDRVVETSFPLFPGYVFCRFDARRPLPIVMSPGVVSIVGFGKEPSPIADSEIEAIETVLRSGLAAGPCAFLRQGQRVRVKHGSLEGLEGILLKKKSEWRIVVSVTMLQRSLSVEIDRDWVEAL
jgi:transcription antitermination factor NusG